MEMRLRIRFWTKQTRIIGRISNQAGQALGRVMEVGQRRERRRFCLGEPTIWFYLVFQNFGRKLWNDWISQFRCTAHLHARWLYMWETTELLSGVSGYCALGAVSLVPASASKSHNPTHNPPWLIFLITDSNNSIGGRKRRHLPQTIFWSSTKGLACRTACNSMSFIHLFIPLCSSQMANICLQPSLASFVPAGH